MCWRAGVLTHAPKVLSCARKVLACRRADVCTKGADAPACWRVHAKGLTPGNSLISDRTFLAKALGVFKAHAALHARDEASKRVVI